MIEQRTIFAGVTVVDAGHLEIKLAKQVVKDGKVIASEWLRTSVECGGDVAAHMKAVNAHLASMDCAAVSKKDCDRIAAIAAADWTKERKDAWTAIKAANAANAAALKGV